MKQIIGMVLSLIYWGCRPISTPTQKNHFPAATYFKTALLLDTARRVSKDAGYNVKDTLWESAIYFDSADNKPVDTVFFAPSALAQNGTEAERFFGKEEELIAYAERKHIRRFCYYKDTLGISFFIHLKKNENYQLTSAKYGNEGNAIEALHEEGWSKLITDSGYWIGDSVLFTGDELALANGAEGLIKCRYH